MRQLLISVAVTLVWIAAAPPANAQSTNTARWEIEAHGGGIWSTAPKGGTAAALPAAAPFTTLAGSQSRHVSSWFFGDGAALLNSVNATLAPNTKITALDGVLAAAGGRRDAGAVFGGRAAYRFGSRYAAELSVDYARTPLTFTAAALDGIEATRSTFVTAIRGLLVSGPSASPNVTATAAVEDGSTYQLQTTGVLTVDLATKGRFVPYVEAGGGFEHNGGAAPAAALTGNYAFSVVGIAPFNETDRVTVRLAARANSPIAVFGGGFHYAMSPKWGIRSDVRATVGGGKSDVVLEAQPSSVLASPAALLISPTNPSVVLSNSTTTPNPSSLSGPAISGLRTFTGSGTAIRANITAGLYFRF